MPGGVPLMDWGVFPERDEEQDDWKVADWAIEQLKAAAKDTGEPGDTGQHERRSSSRPASAIRTSPATRRSAGSTSIRRTP